VCDQGRGRRCAPLCAGMYILKCGAPGWVGGWVWGRQCQSPRRCLASTTSGPTTRSERPPPPLALRVGAHTDSPRWGTGTCCAQSFVIGGGGRVLPRRTAAATEASLSERLRGTAETLDMDSMTWPLGSGRVAQGARRALGGTGLMGRRLARTHRDAPDSRDVHRGRARQVSQERQGTPHTLTQTLTVSETHSHISKDRERHMRTHRHTHREKRTHTHTYKHAHTDLHAFASRAS
jgi:hypothetical protein